MENKDREIARLLAGKGISWNELSDNKKELVRKVYAIASPKLERLAELSQEIDKLKFGKQSLAEEIGISRKTLGSNNPEIAALIEMLVKKGKYYWGTTKTKNIQGEKNEELKKKIELLYARDCELIEKDNECKKLQKEIEARQKQYEKIKKEKEELEIKLDEQAKTLTESYRPFIENTKNNKKN